MDEAELPHAIELLVGLLGLAAFVAIVARPLRLPYTVALVDRRARGRHRLPGRPGSRRIAVSARHRPAGAPARPRLRGRLPASIRRAPPLVRWPGPPGIPGVVISAGIVAIVLNLATGLRLDLAFIVGAMVSATDPAAVVATFKRLRVPPALSTMVDGESLLNDGTGLVLFAIALQIVVAPISPGEAVVAFVGTVAHQRRDRPGDRRRCRPDHPFGGRPPRRADDLGRARIRQLHARGRLPPVRGDRHGHRRRSCSGTSDRAGR